MSSIFPINIVTVTSNGNDKLGKYTLQVTVHIHIFVKLSLVKVTA